MLYSHTILFLSLFFVNETYKFSITELRISVGLQMFYVSNKVFFLPFNDWDKGSSICFHKPIYCIDFGAKKIHKMQ